MGLRQRGREDIGLAEVRFCRLSSRQWTRRWGGLFLVRELDIDECCQCLHRGIVLRDFKKVSATALEERIPFYNVERRCLAGLGAVFCELGTRGKGLRGWPGLVVKSHVVTSSGGLVFVLLVSRTLEVCRLHDVEGMEDFDTHIPFYNRARPTLKKVRGRDDYLQAIKTISIAPRLREGGGVKEDSGGGDRGALTIDIDRGAMAVPG